MIPIVISTYPENGSKDMVLNSPIKIGFAGPVDASTVTTDHIRLENLNESRDIPLTLDYNGSTCEITITPSDDAYNNMLLGLTQYRLTVAGLSKDEDIMQGMYNLEFSTVSNPIEDVIQPDLVGEEFAIVNYYPKKSSYGISPDAIKVKFNKNVLESSVTPDTFIVTKDTVEDLSDLGFISIDAVNGEYNASGNVAAFMPYVEYNEQLGTGSLLTSGLPFNSFTLLKYPVYQATLYVDGTEAVEDTDCAIDLETGAITFLAGKEPAVGATVTATTRAWSKLDDNTRYTVILLDIRSVDVPEALPPTLYSFYTKITPMYAKLADIQANYASVSTLIKGMEAVDVLNIIKENSEMAEWIADQNGNTINWDSPPKYAIEYVKTKTRYDIVFDKYIQLSSEATTKELGDLAIEYNMSLKDLLTLADKLRLAYEYWEGMLKGSASGKTRPKPFKRGENVDEDPDFKNRQFKDWGGTKSW